MYNTRDYGHPYKREYIQSRSNHNGWTANQNHYADGPQNVGDFEQPRSYCDRYSYRSEFELNHALSDYRSNFQPNRQIAGYSSKWDLREKITARQRRVYKPDRYDNSYRDNEFDGQPKYGEQPPRQMYLLPREQPRYLQNFGNRQSDVLQNSKQFVKPAIVKQSESVVKSAANYASNNYSADIVEIELNNYIKNMDTFFNRNEPNVRSYPSHKRKLIDYSKITWDVPDECHPKSISCNKQGNFVSNESVKSTTNTSAVHKADTSNNLKKDLTVNNNHVTKELQTEDKRKENKTITYEKTLIVINPKKSKQLTSADISEVKTSVESVPSTDGANKSTTINTGKDINNDKQVKKLDSNCQNNTLQNTEGGNSREKSTAYIKSIKIISNKDNITENIGQSSNNKSVIKFSSSVLNKQSPALDSQGSYVCKETDSSKRTDKSSNNNCKSLSSKQELKSYTSEKIVEPLNNSDALKQSNPQKKVGDENESPSQQHRDVQSTKKRKESSTSENTDSHSIKVSKLMPSNIYKSYLESTFHSKDDKPKNCTESNNSNQIPYTSGIQNKTDDFNSHRKRKKLLPSENINPSQKIPELESQTLNANESTNRNQSDSSHSKTKDGDRKADASIANNLDAVPSTLKSQNKVITDTSHFEEDKNTHAKRIEVSLLKLSGSVSDVNSKHKSKEFNEIQHRTEQKKSSNSNNRNNNFVSKSSTLDFNKLGTGSKYCTETNNSDQISVLPTDSAMHSSKRTSAEVEKKYSSHSKSNYSHSQTISVSRVKKSYCTTSTSSSRHQREMNEVHLSRKRKLSSISEDVDSVPKTAVSRSSSSVHTTDIRRKSYSSDEKSKRSIMKAHYNSKTNNSDHIPSTLSKQKEITEVHLSRKRLILENVNSIYKTSASKSDPDNLKHNSLKNNYGSKISNLDAIPSTSSKQKEINELHLSRKRKESSIPEYVNSTYKTSISKSSSEKSKHTSVKVNSVSKISNLDALSSTPLKPKEINEVHLSRKRKESSIPDIDAKHKTAVSQSSSVEKSKHNTITSSAINNPDAVPATLSKQKEINEGHLSRKHKELSNPEDGTPTYETIISKSSEKSKHTSVKDNSVSKISNLDAVPSTPSKPKEINEVHLSRKRKEKSIPDVDAINKTAISQYSEEKSKHNTGMLPAINNSGAVPSTLSKQKEINEGHLSRKHKELLTPNFDSVPNTEVIKTSIKTTLNSNKIKIGRDALFTPNISNNVSPALNSVKEINNNSKNIDLLSTSTQDKVLNMSRISHNKVVNGAHKLLKKQEELLVNDDIHSFNNNLLFKSTILNLNKSDMAEFNYSQSQQSNSKIGEETSASAAAATKSILDNKDFSKFHVISKNSIQSDRSQNLECKSENSIVSKSITLQFKALLLLLHTKWNDDFKISLLTEVNEPKHLSDGVFCLEKENHETGRADHSLFIVKHMFSSHFDRVLNIGFRVLNSETSDFNIAKLYKFYLDFQRDNKFVNNITIYSNLELNEISLFKDDIKVTKGTRANSYKLIVSESSLLYKNLMKKFSNLSMLAKLLAEYILTGKNVQLRGLMRKYHLALIHENVIVTGVKKENGKKKCKGKFHQKFIDCHNLSPTARALREDLQIFLGHPISNTMELNINYNFGKGFILHTNPEIHKLDKLASELVTIISLTMKMSNEKILIRKDQWLREDISKIIGHILMQGKDAVVFTEAFLDSDISLPGNLNQLRSLIKEKLKFKDINFSDIGKCKFKMNQFRDKESDDMAKLLPNEDHGRHIKEFFDKLEFVLNPTDIDSKIAAELDPKFQLMRNIDCVNAVQEELLRWLQTNNYKIDPFTLMKNKISKLMVIHRLVRQDYACSDINILFREGALKRIMTCLSDINSPNLILIKTNCTSLSVQKVRQVIKVIPLYLENDSCMFIQIDALLSVLDHVFMALESASTNLLVIECNKIIKAENIIDIFGKLNDVIKKSSENTKKLIIIGKIEYFPMKIQKDDVIIVENYTDLTDITETSQNLLLEKVNVTLHDRQLKLKDIMDIPMLREFVKLPQILMRLVKGDFVIGKQSPDSSPSDDYYIHKQLRRHVVIRESVFKEKVDDIFVIGGIEKHDFRKFILSHETVCYFYELNSNMKTDARFILLGCSGTEVSYDFFVKNNESSNVHLMNYESRNFVWRKSSGSISALLRNKITNRDFVSEPISNPETLADNYQGPKTVIISGMTGAGKSTYIQQVARRFITKSEPLYWIVQVHLNNSIMNRYEKRDIKDYVKFLVELQGYDVFHERIFKMCIEGSLKLKLILLIDGFDELCAIHQLRILNLLKTLQSTGLYKLYLTVGPDSTTKLEAELNIFSYSLDSFSRDEKIEFLTKYWTKCEGAEENKSRERAETLIKMYSESNSVDFTTVPLYLKMLAKIYINDSTVPQVYDYYDLFKHFAIRRMDESVYDLTKIQIASLNRLLNTVQLDTLEINIESKDMKAFDEPNDLNHITFAEYFAAQWLVDHSNSEWLQYASLDCIDSLTEHVSPVFESSLKVLFHLNDRSCYLNLVNFLADTGRVNFLQCLAKMKLYDYCEIEKTPLHFAVESERLEVVKFLLKFHNDTGEHEILEHGEFKRLEYASSKLIMFVNRPVKGSSALQLAAYIGSTEIACELLLAGADVSNVDKQFLHKMAIYIANEIAKVEVHEKHRLRPIAEKLLRITPEAISSLDNKRVFPKLMSYFFLKGRVEIVKHLLNILEDETTKYKYLEIGDGCKTPLDYINDSQFLRDEERLEMIKFLIDKIDTHLCKKDKNYLWSVLCAAVKFGHTRTFEYFIDHYPGSYSGFLKLSLETNKLENIDFLLRNSERTLDQVNGNSPLHIAVLSRVNLSIIKFLTDRGGVNNTNKESENPLCVAIKVGADLALVKFLLKQGANLNAEDKKGLFPWCYAILETSQYTRREQLDIMQYFMQKTVSGIIMPAERNKSYQYDKWRSELALKFELFQNPDIFDLNYDVLERMPRLHSAVMSNNVNWCKFLVVHGADVDIQNAAGKTALHLAVELGRYEIGNILLQNGAMINVKDESKKTPLDILANSNSQDGNGEYTEFYKLLTLATELFTKKKFETTLKSLLQKSLDDDANPMRYLLNCCDKRARNLLHMAAYTNSQSAVKKLIELSAAYAERYRDFKRLDVNARDVDGNTPLHLAAQYGYIELIGELFSAGSCFEMKNVSCKMPLDLANENNHSSATALLKSVGKFFNAVRALDSEQVRSYLELNRRLINVADKSGKTPLHFAAGSTEPTLVKQLLAVRRVHVSATDFGLKTPLHYAVERGSLENVKALLEAGASIDARDREDRRPFDLTDRKRNTSAEMLRLVYKLFADLRSPYPKILLDDCSKALTDYAVAMERDYELKPKVLVNARNAEGCSLLHYAADYGYIGVVQALLRNGAVYNAYDSRRRVPADTAKSSMKLLSAIDFMYSNISVASWTSVGDVDPEVAVRCCRRDGCTLLHQAVKACKIAEIKWLLLHGADVHTNNNEGFSPLQLANESKEIVELLKGQ